MDIRIALVLYILVCLLWSAFACRMQHKLYGDTTKLWQYGLVVFFNLVLCPIAMGLCIMFCPISKETK